MSLVKRVVFTALLAFTFVAHADLTDLTTEGDNYPDYYTIDDKAKTVDASNILQSAVQDLTSSPNSDTSGNSANSLSLLRWFHHNSPPAAPAEHYNRKAQFGRWINDPFDQTCYNTRAKVLIRDSKSAVTFKPTNKCVVDGGSWKDPYTTTTFNTSKEIQIDHVVPLKHAYTSGAFNWNFQKRCLYANFTSNNYHLLSVSGHENMSKGDKSPDQYVPPNDAFVCGYLNRWLRIKAIWGLVIFPPEADGIKGLLDQHNCTANEFKMTAADLKNQRSKMEELIETCAADMHSVNNH